MNWDSYWAKTTEPKDATDFAVKIADRIESFMSKHFSLSVADYGCGPATTILTLAQRLPDVSFTGFDSSQCIIELNRIKAEKAGIRNIVFEIDRLPHISNHGSYDLVLCLSTLHYVEDIESALRSLYQRVSLGGYLIFNYPSPLTQREYFRTLKPGDEETKMRFRLLLNGKNLMTQRRIHEVLKAYPRRFYSSKRFNVYVSVRRS